MPNCRFRAVLTGFLLWSSPSLALRDNEFGLATVLSTTPPASPAFAPFTTLDAPVAFDLGTNGRMTLLHLRSCERMQIEGGQLVVGFRGIETSGRVLSHEGNRCPRPEMIVTDGVLGGVLMRSGSLGDVEISHVQIVAEGSALRVTSPIAGALLLLRQDDDGRLSRLQGPDTIGDAPLLLPGFRPPGGRILAIVGAPGTPGCGNDTLSALLATGPDNGLSAFKKALRDVEAKATGCVGVAPRVLSGELVL